MWAEERAPPPARCHMRPGRGVARARRKVPCIHGNFTVLYRFYLAKILHGCAHGVCGASVTCFIRTALVSRAFTCGIPREDRGTVLHCTCHLVASDRCSHVIIVREDGEERDGRGSTHIYIQYTRTTYDNVNEGIVKEVQPNACSKPCTRD